MSEPIKWVDTTTARKHVGDIGETAFAGLIREGLPRVVVSRKLHLYDLAAIDDWLLARGQNDNLKHVRLNPARHGRGAGRRHGHKLIQADADVARL